MVVNVIVHISACSFNVFRVQKKKIEQAAFFLHRTALERSGMHWNAPKTL
ncbi:unnamed protein product [Staurois parvus]|uniref:Uncharacterized protein n=1 Tax=Staurois parvus TaxID=386267 RepID=A0ABN9CI77_9NEOB|nr:unnamed protein product [Staurois parvus]